MMLASLVGLNHHSLHRFSLYSSTFFSIVNSLKFHLFLCLATLSSEFYQMIASQEEGTRLSLALIVMSADQVT